jgi:hypothetical protein
MRKISTRHPFLKNRLKSRLRKTSRGGAAGTKAAGHKNYMVAAVPKTSMRCTRFSIGAL